MQRGAASLKGIAAARPRACTDAGSGDGNCETAGPCGGAGRGTRRAGRAAVIERVVNAWRLYTVSYSYRIVAVARYRYILPLLMRPRPPSWDYSCLKAQTTLKQPLRNLQSTIS